MSSLHHVLETYVTPPTVPQNGALIPSKKVLICCGNVLPSLHLLPAFAFSLFCSAAGSPTWKQRCCRALRRSWKNQLSSVLLPPSQRGGRENVPENIAGWTRVPGDTGQVRGQDLALSPELI